MEPLFPARHESVLRGWVYLAQTMLLQETTDWRTTKNAAMAAIPQFTAAPEINADLPFYRTWTIYSELYYRYWCRNVSDIRNNVESNIIRIFKERVHENTGDLYFNRLDKLPSGTPVPYYCDFSCEKTTCPVRKQQLALLSSRVISAEFRDAYGAMLLELLKNIFYCWRGKSGNRYPCTIFGLHQSALLASQPRLAVAAAKRSQTGVACRTIIPLDHCDTASIAQQCNSLLRLDCSEWHVPYGMEGVDSAQFLSDFPHKETFRSDTDFANLP